MGLLGNRKLGPLGSIIVSEMGLEPWWVRPFLVHYGAEPIH